MFQLGDRVASTEGQSLPDGSILPRAILGTVQEAHDAFDIYPQAPRYKSKYKGERKATKFPLGTKVYRIMVDGEKTQRNFHESQLSHA